MLYFLLQQYVQNSHTTQSCVSLHPQQQHRLTVQMYMAILYSQSCVQ